MISHKLILASKSPRRQELMQLAGFDFRIKLKEVAEDYPEDMPLREVPVFLAEKKAAALTHEIKGDEVIVAADTLVFTDDRILGKPLNEVHAVQMLKYLSGKAHYVVTGVCLLSNTKQKSFAETTKVVFKELSDKEISYYLEHYKPYDKAGAYGIQEWIGLIGIEKIEGDYFNVVGLPVNRLYKELLSF